MCVIIIVVNCRGDFMFKSISSKFFRVLFFFFISAVCIVDVNAFKAQEKETSDLFLNCNSDSKCIPLCVYDYGSYFSHLSPSDDFATGVIGFYYGTVSKYNWEIGNIKFIDNDKYYYLQDVFMPIEDVYDNTKNASWKDGDIYNSITDSNQTGISNNFSCPKYFHVDTGANDYNELCFSNDVNSCINNHNNIGTDFGSYYSLKYSFFDTEYFQILNDVYQSNLLHDSNNGLQVNDNDKIKYLYSLDGENEHIKYNESLSPEENAKNNCDYIKERVETLGSLAEYVKSITSSNETYVENTLNPALKTAAEKYGSKYVDFYNYTTLVRTVTNKTSDGKFEYKRVGVISPDDQNVRKNPIFLDIDQMYNYNADIAVLYVKKQCDIVGVKIDDDSNLYELSQGTKQDYTLKHYSDPEIFFDDEYNCSFLSDIADMIGTAYFILELAGLAILAILSVLDYAKVFLNDNADELKKANSNFIKRLIIAVVLFLLPALVNFMLGVFRIEGINSENPLCIKISNK